MAGIRLDDFLSKKKEVAQVLDLSKSVARTKEELKKLLDKVPEFKSKAEKIRADDIKIRDKDWNFKPTKKELRHVPEFTFANPVPTEMRAVKLDDLISVPIDWRMLTTLRPRTKLEEDYFSRLIELGKLSRSTLQYERQREGPRSTYAATSSSWVKRFKSRSGVVETKATTCGLCGDEFCDGTACKLFTYDLFIRTSLLEPAKGAAGDKAGLADKGAKKKKKKRGRASRAVKSAKAPPPPPAGRRGGPNSRKGTAAGGGTRGPSLERRRDASRHRSSSAPPAPRGGTSQRSQRKGGKK